MLFRSTSEDVAGLLVHFRGKQVAPLVELGGVVAYVHVHAGSHNPGVAWRS